MPAEDAMQFALARELLQDPVTTSSEDIQCIDSEIVTSFHTADVLKQLSVEEKHVDDRIGLFVALYVHRHTGLFRCNLTPRYHVCSPSSSEPAHDLRKHDQLISVGDIIVIGENNGFLTDALSRFQSNVRLIDCVIAISFILLLTGDGPCDVSSELYLRTEARRCS